MSVKDDNKKHDRITKLCPHLFVHFSSLLFVEVVGSPDKHPTLCLPRCFNQSSVMPHTANMMHMIIVMIEHYFNGKNKCKLNSIQNMPGFTYTSQVGLSISEVI